MKKRYEINMTKGPLLPELLQFILPLMLSSMLQIAFNAADLIVVGRFGRPHSMAAVGANGAMINLIINVLMGLATGGGVLCARYYGANQTDKLHRTVSTTLITGVIGGVITGALGLALTVPLLRLVGSPDEVLPLATVYLRIYFLGLPVMALYNFSAAALRALGNTRQPLIYLAIAKDMEPSLLLPIGFGAILMNLPGADLENLSNAAALLAARRGSKLITMADFSEAEIKVIAGPEKKSRVVSEHERKLTAYHEAGHAIVMHALPTHDPVHQITIVPRGGAGGMTISLPTEDRSYQSKRYMEEQIVSLLGGRVAEKLMLGDISTGASNDIQRASQIARKMVTAYGMSEKLGSIAFESGHDEVFIGKTMGQTRSYSEKTAAEIDDEVKAIIDRAYARCEEILTARREALTAVAEYLLAHETMTGEEFERMVGEKA